MSAVFSENILMEKVLMPSQEVYLRTIFQPPALPKRWNDGVINEILQNPIYTGGLLLQKTLTTEVIPFKRKINKGQLPKYFIKDNHEPIITRQQAEAVKEILKYRRKQIGVDDSGKYQNRYEFSSKIICGEYGSTFRRQKIYIGKPYEKIQWCCHRHITDKTKCRQKAVREDILKGAFTVMWNKLISNYTELLLPLLESLKKLRTDEQQEREIWKCNNRIMELTEQSHILSRIVSKGYIDSAVFIERQNKLMLELDAERKKRNRLLDTNGFDREIAGTVLLLELIRNNQGILEEYRIDLFLQTVDKISILNNRILFRLINGLELTECYGKEVNEDDAAPYANRLQTGGWQNSI